MNRRSFFAAIAAPVVAGLFPKPDLSEWSVNIETGPAYFSGDMALSMEEFQRRYLQPAWEAWADGWDRCLIEQYNSMTNENGRYTHFRHPRGLDPNRLPV